MPDASIIFQQVAETETPAAIKMRVRNAAQTGSRPLNFVIISDSPWLVVSPNQGSLASNESSETWVSANTSGLTSGTYVGNLTISDAEALNSPFVVEFTLQISTCPETFVVTITSCTSTVVDAPVACTSNIQVAVEPCTSAIQAGTPGSCSSTILGVVSSTCTSTIQGQVSTTCTSTIQGQVSTTCTSAISAAEESCTSAIQGAIP